MRIGGLVVESIRSLAAFFRQRLGFEFYNLPKLCTATSDLAILCGMPGMEPFSGLPGAYLSKFK